jgi:hypothetical protein
MENFYQTTQHHIPEYIIPFSHCHVLLYLFTCHVNFFMCVPVGDIFDSHTYSVQFSWFSSIPSGNFQTPECLNPFRTNPKYSYTSLACLEGIYGAGWPCFLWHKQ